MTKPKKIPEPYYFGEICKRISLLSEELEHFTRLDADLSKKEFEDLVSVIWKLKETLRRIRRDIE